MSTQTQLDDSVAGQSQYLTFRLAGEEYGVGILRVREILEYDTVTRVPATPPYFRGVINLRGSVVPVIDLAVKFGLPESQTTKRTCIVIVEAELDGSPTVMGIMADAVSEVVDLGPDDIEAPPAFGTRVRHDHLVGMGKRGSKFSLLLDMDRVLAAEELRAVAEPEAEAAGAGEEPAAPAEPTPAAAPATPSRA